MTIHMECFFFAFTRIIKEMDANDSQMVPLAGTFGIVIHKQANIKLCSNVCWNLRQPPKTNTSIFDEALNLIICSREMCI